MTTAIRAPWYLNKPCLHRYGVGISCALCSDEDPRWRSWRNGANPPNESLRLQAEARRLYSRYFGRVAQ